MSFEYFFSSYDSNVKNIYNKYFELNEQYKDKPLRTFDLNTSDTKTKIEKFIPKQNDTNNLDNYERWASIGNIIQLPEFFNSKVDYSKPKKIKNAKGSEEFEKVFAQAVSIYPEAAKYKNFLTLTADRESNFDSYVQNKAGAPYYGYFQMGQEEIKSTTGLTVEEFRRDPVQQIIGACKLYDKYLNTVKKLGVYDLCKQKGYSDDAIVAGAWLGGPGGVKKFITEQGDPSDSHWYGGKGGTSVGKLMNQFKNEK